MERKGIVLDLHFPEIAILNTVAGKASGAEELAVRPEGGERGAA